MQESDLDYSALKQRIAPIETATGLAESASFLCWFLQNVYRLDELDARDAICDHANDKGIDGIYVDENNSEVHFLQSKIRQSKGTIGDTDPKRFVASVDQFSTVEKIEAILAGNADAELKRLIERTKLIDLVAEGYTLIGVYVTNESHDVDSKAYEAITPSLHIFDRGAIAAGTVDVAASGVKQGNFTFDTDYVTPMKMTTGSGTFSPTMFVFPARALQLVHMDGIADGSLFEANVRHALGNTSVNKAIRGSVQDKSTHVNFALFHNGVTILCRSADDSVPDKLTITDYAVVNGAQSLTTFFNTKAKLTSDLRVLVRVIVVSDEALARTITHNSNNQNAIRPRDLRSNDLIMARLQTEMTANHPEYFFEVKRGEVAPSGAQVIGNDLAGRALLAFDVLEPWSSHQIYKVFDEKYSEIFGRPEVTADRIALIQRLVEETESRLAGLSNRAMASYGLTKYFLLYVLSRILRDTPESAAIMRKPESLSAPQVDAFLARCGEILDTLMIDLDFEAKEDDFDYKSTLKSQTLSTALGDRIVASYKKDVARSKAASFNGWSADQTTSFEGPTP